MEALLLLLLLLEFLELVGGLACGEAPAELSEPFSETWSRLWEGGKGRFCSNLLVGAGSLTMGAAIGLNTLWLFHERLTPRRRVLPGISVVLVPIAAGIVMHFFGKWHRKHGGHPSPLATFWGGALFGFGAALARFLIVGS